MQSLRAIANVTPKSLTLTVVQLSSNRCNGDSFQDLQIRAHATIKSMPVHFVV